jgi:hypothetical protein
MTTVNGISILVLLLLGTSCARPDSAGPEANANPNLDMGIPDIPSLDDAPCRAGKTDCDGVCVDLQADDANCGVCGFSCLEGYYYDGDPFCKFGECTPTIQGCLREDSGFATCTEFCASFGEACRGPGDELNCGYTIELTATTFPDECWQGIGTNVDAGCDAAIPYNYVLGPHTFDVAHCCCTHTPQ